MNLSEADVLRTLQSEPYVNQRVLSIKSGHCLGVVNKSLKRLMEEGYIDEGVRLTEKAKADTNSFLKTF